jgi:hypothetical protein
MTTPPLPYFFDEAARASMAKQPGDREKALGFTINDLKWLNNIYLATQAARTAQKVPMSVYQLLLSETDTPDVPLAGAFAMSQSAECEVTLYTPWKGLIKFADMEDLKSKLKEWLTQTTANRELLRFLSIEQRCALPAATTPDISTKEIEGGVFEVQALPREQSGSEHQGDVGRAVQNAHTAIDAG